MHPYGCVQQKRENAQKVKDFSDRIRERNIGMALHKLQEDNHARVHITRQVETTILSEVPHGKAIRGRRSRELI
jgi:hypothetical protein